MNAVVLTKYGSTDVLELREVDAPVPERDEVLVRVRATAINDWDWSFMRGKPWPYRLLFGFLAPKVCILGAEVAGEVAALGDGVTRFAVGDAVYGDISEDGFGAFAEYVSVSTEALAHKPETLSFPEAAAVPHAGGLAIQGLIDIGQVRSGDEVLINGGGGGVGALGVQIAKRYGAKVTGVDRAEKFESMRALGFDHVVDYSAHDFTKLEPRYDLVLDTKTTRSPWRHAACLKPGGRYVTIGGAVRRLLQTVVVGPLVSRLTGKTFRVVALKPNKGLESIAEHFEAGRIQLAIDGPYALNEIPRAMERFGRGAHLGKVVIVVDVDGGSRPHPLSESLPRRGG